MSWSGGYAEWVEGDTAYLSIAFTWLLDKAYMNALKQRALGRTVRVGGPALFQLKMQHELAALDGVLVGGDYPEAVTKHNPQGTFFSRGCPGSGTEEKPKPCPFCLVPPMEGTKFTLIPDAVPRPVLCDNNLSALPAHYQQHIIDRYLAARVPLLDANSGFEPRTFTPDVFARWKPLMDNTAGLRDQNGEKFEGSAWRFAYDDMHERDQVHAVMRMLADVRSKRKRVYVLIGNEPFGECMQRIREVIAGGCEPHVQPEIKLSSHERRPWVKASCGWEEEAVRRGIVVGRRDESLTPGEKLLRQVARWANSFSYKKCTFDEWDPTRNNARSRPVYDATQGLFTEEPVAG